MLKYDVVIVGAGIVGLATAYKLQKAQPNLRICILEKEQGVAKHQTGNNSGVIHSGIYYKPGSLKATNCKSGYDELLVFAKEYGIAHDICGKVIVATSKAELQSLDNIYTRGVQNGLEGIKKISAEETREIEPYVNAVASIFVPQTGIIDFPQMCEKLSELIIEAGGDIKFGAKVLKITPQSGFSIVDTEGGAVEAKLVINCAGLYADKVSQLTERDIDVQVVPFRGEYYELKSDKQYLVRNLIYPVPNPDFPFLGVHFTRMIKGGIEAGPNAVLAFKREGYSRWDFDSRELWEILTYKGFQKIAAKYWREGLDELYRSYSKRAFVRALQHLIPDIGYDDLTEGGAGVRAQAIDIQGNMVDDFSIRENKYVVNVINAPSPAATACLAVGGTIAEKALKRF